MELLGVEAVDTRDNLGRGRFFTFDTYYHLNPTPNLASWYWNYIAYPEENVRITFFRN